MMYCDTTGPKARKPNNHDLKSPKPCTKIKTLSFKLTITGICYSNRKLTDEGPKSDLGQKVEQPVSPWATRSIGFLGQVISPIDT
jgi:hypothetical protein